MLKIGVLALQGAFLEHEQMLDRLGVAHFQIRQLSDLSCPMDGLIIPGGESTAIGKLLNSLDMMSPLREKVKEGLPVFGTCAGMILLANEIENDPKRYLQVMDICVKRNAYGRQLGSFFTHDLFAGQEIPMTFIRAPYINKAGAQVEILSTVDGHIVAAREKNMLVCSFHPELTDDTTVHAYFIEKIVKKEESPKGNQMPRP